MKHRLPYVLLLSLFPAAPATPAGAQALPVPIALEARLGAVLPLGSFGEPGPGVSAAEGSVLGLAARAHLLPPLGIYGGYQRSRFGCLQCGEFGLDPAIVAEALEAGIHLSVAGLPGRASPWVKVGALRETLAFSGSGERLVSAPAVGLGTGAGVAVRMGRLELVPGLHYQSVPARFEFTDLPPRSLEARRWGLGLGVALPLGTRGSTRP